MPLSASHVDIWATQDVLDLADRASKRACIVMNRTRANTRLGTEIDQTVAELEADIAKSKLGNRIAFAESLGQGLGVMEAKRGSTAASEATALAKEIVGML